MKAKTKAHPRHKANPNWGGKRPGSGPKKKTSTAPKIEVIERPASAEHPLTTPIVVFVTDEGDRDVQAKATRYLDLAIETLASISSGSSMDAARVSAATRILEVAAGKFNAGTAAAAAPGGKKAAAQAAAEAMVKGAGVFDDGDDFRPAIVN